MNSRVRVIFSSMMVVLIALASAFSVIPARADDGAPPPTAPSAPKSPGAHSQVPAGTDVAVVNAAGHKVSLASQEAADIVASGDPIWCPTGVTPGGATCSASFGNLQALVAAVGAGFNPAKNGAIWIQNTTFPSAGDIVFDGTTSGTWATWSNFSLTFKGGWLGSGAVITTTPSTLQDPLKITNWHADVTLNNIVVTNVVGPFTTALHVDTSRKIVLNTMSVDSNDIAGAALVNTAGTSDVMVTSSEFSENNGGNGLYISSRGAITLSDVTADFNHAVGAVLDNSAAFSAKSVTLKVGPFEFNNNAVDTGLVILSRGSITLMNIAANTNGGEGAYLDNTAGTIAAAVSITGTNFFSENSDRGLDVVSNGAITANNLVANANGGRGAWLDNCQAYSNSGVCFTATVMPVKLTGSNQFKFNAGGLRIVTNGVITLSNINASNNYPNSGVWINNDTSFLGAGVTMTGTTTLDNNGGGGLYLNSRGAVMLSNLSASGNGGDGADIWNNTAFTPKPVTLSVSGGNPDTNTNNNNGTGLEIFSKGAISVTGISANNNWGGNGATLENDFTGAVGGVTIGGWGGGFINNNGYGLDILTKGAVNVTGLYAGSNGSWGASIDNHLGTGPVTLGTGKSMLLWNNTLDGLDVYSKGAITLNNVNADGNLNGAWLQNDYAGAPNVTIKNTPTFSPSFNNNWFDGLVIHSRGSITLMDVNAYSNGQVNFTAADLGNPIDHTVGFGIVLDNHSGSGGVTIGTSRHSWCNAMSNNFQSGLVVHSSGAVIMSNMCNDNNGGYFNLTGFDPLFDVGNGAFIDNTTGFSKPVTLKNSNGWNNEFNNNYNTGLVVLSRGAITATDLNAYGSTNEGGAMLNNAFPGAAGAVTITSPASVMNSFDNNATGGLEIHSNRAITVSNLEAGNNGGMGAILDNTTSTYFLPQNVTVKGLNNNFNNNGDTGLVVTSFGLITVNNIDAENNGQNNWMAVNAIIPLPPVNSFGWGAYLDNCGFNWISLGCTSLGIPKGITVNSTTLNTSNQFNGNFMDGLWATSRGPITAHKIKANNNGSDGAYLDNQWPGAASSVTLTSAMVIDWNEFSNNGYSGYGNGWTASDGLEVYSNRTINLNDVLANGNNHDGANVDTSYHYGPYAAQNVNFTGRNSFDSNGDDGLNVTADGNITVKNLSSTNNGQNNFYNQAHSLPIDPFTGWGAYLDNCSRYLVCAYHGNITLTGTNTFNQNFQDGLFADSHGNIAMSNVRADGNGGNGVYVTADGKIFVSCGSMTNNGSYGWSFGSLTTVTLKFVSAFGNNGGFGNTQLLFGTLVTSSTCP